MSEGGQAPVGQILRDAREARGITLENAAERLRLMHRQVEAMEANDFASLGQPVFARGFVRNYARLLGLAPEALLARMEGAPDEPVAVSRSEAPLPRSWLTSPWLILLLLGLLVVVVVPVALYGWLNSEGEVPPGSQVSAAAHTPPVSVAPPPVAAPALALPVVEPIPAPEATPAAPTGTAVEAAAPAQPASPAIRGVLHLEFGAESWVEIQDASGRMLHRQLNPPGSSVDVNGQPPFDVVIGNAEKAHMTYNGRPIDLKPFTAATVARFTLEE